MRRRWLLFSLLLVLSIATWLILTQPSTQLLAGSGLNDADAHAVRKVVPPQLGEDAFDAIPWQTSIWDARQLAAKLGKPILLWEMDGHPLGCG